jgi:hypothetical protein
MVARHPPLSKREHAEIVKKNNKSGWSGFAATALRKPARSRTQEKRWFWVASWVLPDGRAKRSSSP